MAERIPQSTSYLMVFKAFLTATGLEATGKTIAITISKNGATSFSNPNAGATNATEMASGWYKVTLDTTDTGTVGPLAVRGAVSGILDVGVLLDVVKATNFGMTALPDTAATTNASLLTSGTGTDQLSVASGRTDLGKILGTAVSTPATAGILDVNVKNIVNVAAALDANNFLKVDVEDWKGAAAAAMTGDAYARLGAPAGASVSADIAAVKSDTGTTLTDVNSGAGAIYTRLGAPAGASLAADIAAAKSDTAAIKAKTDSLTFTVSAKLDCNVYTWSGTAVASPNTAGVPVVDTRGVIRSNTAQATGNSTTAIKLDSGASATTDFYKYHRITVISGTGAPQSAICTAYNGSTKVATVSPAWPTAPDNTSVFIITVDSQSDIETILGTASAATAGYVGPDWGHINAPTTTVDLSGTTIKNVDNGVTVATNNDKTGYSLTQAFPTNFASLGISAGGHISNVDTITTYTGNTVQTGDAFARLGAPAGASVSADIAAVKVDTAAIKVQTDKLTFTVTQKLDVNVYTWNGTAVATPDTAGYPKVTIKSGTGTGEISLAAGLVTAGTVGDKTGYALTAAYDAAKTASQAGDIMKVSSGTGANQISLASGIIADPAGVTTLLSRLTSTRAGLIDHLDADISSRLASGSYTAPLDAGGTRSAVGLASANLDTQLSGINSKTTNLPAAPADESLIIAATNAIASAIAALNNLSAAQVNAEVVDALATDTYAEPGQGAPGATISLAAKLNFLYKAFRNKVDQTATDYKLYADDSTTVDHKATVSDDGTTFSRTEIASGP